MYGHDMEALYDVYVKHPQSVKDWKNILKGFKNTYIFPHCIWAVDGKYIAVMQGPIESGS